MVFVADCEAEVIFVANELCVRSYEASGCSAKLEVLETWILLERTREQVSWVCSTKIRS